MLPKHTPLAARKALSRKLHAAKAEKRLALGVDAETLRWRAMHPISHMNQVAEHTTTIPAYKTYTGVIAGVPYDNAPQEALRARVESASAIITELLARTARTESSECDEAVAAAMAWLADHK